MRLIMSKRKIQKLTTCLAIFITCVFTISVINLNENQTENTVTTNSGNILSDKKIEWGIKRGKNHEQPDLGSENKKIIDKYEGISMGNSEKPYIYLTFDCGYEAGYTEKILEVLKQNEVKATFLITGHYLNSKPDLVKRMIYEGHIIGNHTPKCLMSGNDINVKC